MKPPDSRRDARKLMTDRDTSRSPLHERRAGVCLHVSALPGPFGIGELGASARAFLDAMQDMRLGVWQFLPLGPTAYGDSPYQPLSTFAGNEMLIDMGDLADRGLLDVDELAPLTALPDDRVDFGTLIPQKSQLLDTAARRFAAQSSPRQQAAFAAFVDANDALWLHDYAMFRILKARHEARPWPEWERRFRQRDPRALKELAATAAADINAIKVQQFLFHEQWLALRTHARKRGVALFGDMPIYIALDSADAWARPQILRIDADGQPDFVAGVPPDYFSEDGQLWGNPLYAWQHHAACGYRWWIDRIRAALALMDIVRIDHFRGFAGYWAVPADASTARDGAWETGPGSALFDALRAELGEVPIVAEDLGVITPDVVALRKSQHLPGMRVLQFEIADPEFRLDSIETDSVCYTGTHDNDTTAGWFHGGPGDTRSEAEIATTRQAALNLTLGSPETIHLDLVRLALASNARLAMVPMQDLLGLGSEARFNTPGTSAGNWRWRLKAPQLTTELCDNVAGMVRNSGRSPDDPATPDTRDAP